MKYFAVVSNLQQWSTLKLLQWHREKAGTIERVHDILKNDLGAGVMPCGRFGANAAWLRLNVLTHNVLTALKRLALPPELAGGAPQALTLSDFPYARANRASCAASAVAVGGQPRAPSILDQGPGVAAPAGGCGDWLRGAYRRICEALFTQGERGG